MKRVERPRNPTMACPHCGGRLTVRGSEQVTLTVRELRMDCGECGARMIGQLSLVRTLRASDCPNEAVCLPLSGHLRGSPRIRPANDDAPIPANDDAPAGPPPAVAHAAPG